MTMKWSAAIRSISTLDAAVPQLAAVSAERRQHLIEMAKIRRGEAIWLLPLAFAAPAGFIMCAALLSLTAATMGPAPAGGGFSLFSVAMALLLGALPAFITVFALVRRVMIIRSLRLMLNRTACPYCEFELRGLPLDGETVRCPECGERSTLHELRVSRTEMQTENQRAPSGEDEDHLTRVRREVERAKGREAIAHGTRTYSGQPKKRGGLPDDDVP
jgi:ssDNA-binding Zn-finger/Zn-ribbon topoisomerase 1